MLPCNGVLLPLIIVLAATGSGSALDPHSPGILHNRGAQWVNFWKLHRAASTASTSRQQRQEHATQAWTGVSRIPLAAAAAVPEFPAETFTQSLDHFHNSTDATFPQRFWVNSRHYKPRPGAPVIVIDGGETNGEDRLPFLDTGIADILARATGGVGVVLEHRYYGESIGVQNFSTDTLRWLNNEQSLEDSANFMRNVKIQDIDEDLTASNTPWIYYDGSCAGARAARMRVLYPDLVFGAIASSSMVPFSRPSQLSADADAKCSSNLVNSISTIDRLLKFRHLRGPLKKLFGLGGLESDQDFVSVLTYPLASWQDRNWNSAVSSTLGSTFDHFCTTLNGDTPTLEDTARTVVLPGPLRANVALLNYAKWIRENVVNHFCRDPSLTVEDCFGTNDNVKYQVTDLSQDWRLWVFQFCTQWDHLTTAPLHSTPTIISRLLGIDYEHKICTQAFPPGEHYRVPPQPNVTAVNALGEYHIAADRLAFIDGDDEMIEFVKVWLKDWEGSVTKKPSYN